MFCQQTDSRAQDGGGITVARLRMPVENNNESLKFLTTEETAELLQISRRTLQRMIHRKDLPAFKVGGQWRIHENALAKWLDGLNEQ